MNGGRGKKGGDPPLYNKQDKAGHNSTRGTQQNNIFLPLVFYRHFVGQLKQF
jgi:hypothetical protein